jgi:uncharacterized protein YhaN
VLATHPDELTTRTEIVARELRELNTRVTAAANEHGEASRALADLERASATAADAASDAEQARAEMAAQAEVYILKRAQALTLRCAIERYRERHQDPLLVRASELFSTLTLGRYSALRIELGEATPRLLGIMDQGRAAVEISDMSEGTTDQLFLALRLAAVELAVDSGIRLPFLADDLFVNFDDDRAEAGLRVLAELATKTQVLFFTHHSHLAAIARSVLGNARYSECRLAAAAPSTLPSDRRLETRRAVALQSPCANGNVDESLRAVLGSNPIRAPKELSDVSVRTEKEEV